MAEFESLATLKQRLAEGTTNCREITEYYNERIRLYNQRLNALVTACPEQAVAEAARADQMTADTQQQPLRGLPVVHKDIFCTRGVRTTCGSRMLDNFIPPYDATVVAGCRKQGAPMLGKTNMDEFGMGSANENSFYGPVRNPWHLDYSSGGSSGGAAAAVAAGLAPWATGTDTGGSIRLPAAWCGITGIKPTYGRLSRYGMIAYASSLDQAGVFARNAADATEALASLSGPDPRDSTSIRNQQAITLPEGFSLTGLRIGMPRQWFEAELPETMHQVLDQALASYRQLGAELVPVDMPHLALALPAYYILAPAEASANLARYDGVRFGYRCDQPADLKDLYERSRSEGFGNEVKRRILIGTYVLSSGYYDAYYAKAQKIRRLISQEFAQAFNVCDILAGPVSPAPAQRLEQACNSPVDQYNADLYTIPASLAGLPALSHPAGFINNLPVGLQLIGPHFHEAGILASARRFQQATDWHHYQPSAYKE